MMFGRKMISRRCFSVNNMGESYIPAQLPPLKNGAFVVYECRTETKKVQKYMYFPLPPIAALTSYMMYKTVFWSSFFQILWPTFPLAFLITIRKNLIDNC